MRALCIVDLHVAFNKIETLSVVMEMQQWLTFVLLSRYKIFQTAVNNIISLKSPYKLAGIVARNLTKYVIYCTSPPIPNFKKICPVGAALIHADGRTDMTKLTGTFR